MKQFFDYLRPKPTLEKATLKVQRDGDRYEIILGKRSFEIASNASQPTDRENYDFALFGALAMALTHNVEITTDLPISQSAADAAHEINSLMELWQSRKIYPTPLKFNNIIEKAAPKPDLPGLICLSGGIDSTFAALESQNKLNITHGMLIAGADYPSKENPGFISLRSRVEKIASILELELIIVETSIRKHGFQWEMLHTLNLAMCLNFNAEQFGYGVIAADWTAAQEFNHHPWGNNRTLVSALSSDQFPIHHVGSDHTRSQKTRKIIKHPSGVGDKISVCFEDTTHGGNCGICSKCIRTRLNILTSGKETPELFKRNDPLEDLVAKLPMPKYQARKLRALAVMLDIRDDLPEGAVKVAVVNYVDRLKSRILPTGR